MATPRRRRATPRTRAASKEKLRERIVAAALHLFNTRGFDATTTKAIARRARVAEGTVFNYFRTKEDIALHFFEKELDAAFAAVQGNARLRNAPIQERLFVLIQSQLDYLAPHQNFIGAALLHALRPASKLGPLSVKSQEIQLRYISFVQDLLDDAVERREITPAAWWTPQLFWIYYLGVLIFWLQDASPGKQHTLAFLDRSLHFGVAMIRREA